MGYAAICRAAIPQPDGSQALTPGTFEVLPAECRIPYGGTIIRVHENFEILGGPIRYGNPGEEGAILGGGETADGVYRKFKICVVTLQLSGKYTDSGFYIGKDFAWQCHYPEQDERTVDKDGYVDIFLKWPP
jgi:hypothetical protein